jgi:hypothetical protein
MSQRPSRPPPNLPPEEPAVPLDPAVAKVRATFVRAQVQKVQDMKQEGKNETEIREAVSRFADDYPTLFKKLLASDDPNDTSLRTMLLMLDRMGSGELSQHQASIIVGQRLHDKYIKPKMEHQ